VFLVQMAIAGGCGLAIDLPARTASGSTPIENAEILAALFAEEAGVVLEVSSDRAEDVMTLFRKNGLEINPIGKPSLRLLGEVVTTLNQILFTGFSTPDRDVMIRVGGKEVLREGLSTLRMEWEATSLALDRLQANPSCVESEAMTLVSWAIPKWHVPFEVGPRMPVT
jgi:phosphoribosylformylglycinamidine synthase